MGSTTVLIMDSVMAKMKDIRKIHEQQCNISSWSKMILYLCNLYHVAKEVENAMHQFSEFKKLKKKSATTSERTPLEAFSSSDPDLIDENNFMGTGFTKLDFEGIEVDDLLEKWNNKLMEAIFQYSPRSGDSHNQKIRFEDKVYAFQILKDKLGIDPTPDMVRAFVPELKKSIREGRDEFKKQEEEFRQRGKKILNESVDGDDPDV